MWRLPSFSSRSTMSKCRIDKFVKLTNMIVDSAYDCNYQMESIFFLFFACKSCRQSLKNNDKSNYWIRYRYWKNVTLLSIPLPKKVTCNSNGVTNNSLLPNPMYFVILISLTKSYHVLSESTWSGCKYIHGIK